MSVFTETARHADSVIIDTETINSVFGREIIEIGAILLKEGDIICEFDQLIRPLGDVPLSALHFSGIVPDELDSQPLARQVIPVIIKAIQELSIIGHNISYDITSINKEADRIGCAHLDAECIDTLEIARSRFPNAPSVSLQEVMHLLGQAVEDHRALSDAKWTLECWRRLTAMQTPLFVPETARRDAQYRVMVEKRRRERIFVRSEYFKNHDITAQNRQPPGTVLSTVECGVEVSGDENHQTILGGYGYDAWLWVFVIQDFIRTGKYAGYPTYWVYLDGEEIGYISEYQMERHCGQIPPEGAVLLSHIPNRVADINKGKWQLRLQLPFEHEPVDLSSNVKKVRKTRKPAEKSPVQKTPIRNPKTNNHEHFINVKPHKKVLSPGGKVRVIYLDEEAQTCLDTYESGSRMWVFVRVSEEILTVRFKGDLIGTIDIKGDAKEFSPDGNVAAATIVRNENETIVEVELPAPLT
ncbi:exonuclease domain-containing protein [Bifidobacterium crudilactis]|uniref:3'-5' exonuclease n=1 Tax=Bifidobacterium crudilactis TaxID=327277 RepID=UPI003A5C586F